jgi:hypothetical protein
MTVEQRTQTPTQPPTPVTDDAHATAPELLARAAVDYRNAHTRRTRENNATGNKIGGR